MTAKTEIRIGPLSTVGGVVSELGKIYRAARRGQIDVTDATRLAYILREIRCALEASEIEKRLGDLERLETEPRRLAA